MTAASASRSSLTRQATAEEGFLAVARRWWKLLVLAPLVCAALAYVYAIRTDPTYEAEAQLLVVPRTADNSGLSIASDSAPTYVELVTSPAILTPTVRKLGLQYGVAGLRTKVRAEADRTTRLVTIRVRDEDSARAAGAATELAGQLQAYVGAQARSPGAPSGGPNTLEIVERGASSRVAPNVLLSTSFGAFAGLLLSAALALLLGAKGGGVASGEELGALTDAPFLGTVQRPTEPTSAPERPCRTVGGRLRRRAPARGTVDGSRGKPACSKSSSTRSGRFEQRP